MVQRAWTDQDAEAKLPPVRPGGLDKPADNGGFGARAGADADLLPKSRSLPGSGSHLLP